MRLLFAIMVWTGIVTIATVAIIESSTGAAVEAIRGDAIRSATLAEMQSIARDAARDAASNGKSGASLKDWGETAQAWMTALGIFVAGGWALYVFLVGRTHVGVAQIQLEPKRLLVVKDRKAAVVLVTIKNTGHTLVRKRLARIHALPMTDDQLEIAMSVPSAMPAAVPRSVPIGTVLFGKHQTELEEAVDSLEPGQGTSEEVVVILGDAHVARMEAVFVGIINRPFRRPMDRTFSSRIILDMKALEQRSEA